MRRISIVVAEDNQEIPRSLTESLALSYDVAAAVENDEQPVEA